MDSPERFMVTLERPPSLVLTQKTQENQQSMSSLHGSIQLEDLDSAPTSPSAQQETPTPAEPSGGAATAMSASFRSDEDDIVAVAARAERQSNQAKTAESVHVAGKIDSRGTNQELEPQKDRLWSAYGGIAISESAFSGKDKSLSSRPQAPENNNDDEQLHRHPSMPQLRISVRSHGAVDSTMTQEKLKPQTLRSTEDLKRAVAAAEASEGPTAASSPRSKKSGFISDIKQILRRKKTPPSPELAKLAMATTSPTGNQKPNNDRSPQCISPTRSLSLPALGSKDDIAEELPRHSELSFQHPTSKPRSPAILQNAQTQTLSQTVRNGCADKATETAAQVPEQGDESIHAALLQTLERKLKNMQTCPSQLGPLELVQDVLARSGTLATDASRNNHNQLENEGSAPLYFAPYSQQEQQHHRNSSRSELPRREAQSALYRKWQNDRAQKVAQLAFARDQHSLKQAQHSMQLFQQTLASIQGVQR